MKIAFLTSCLEPGRDGVGDYSALLAEECARLGHSTALLALNDPFAGSGSGSSGLLRLSSSEPWTSRIAKAAAWLKAFGPDFVSVQFVCYGFHPRGMDLRLAARLKKIIGDRPVQIMFHELWVGTETRVSLKERLTGAVQRRGVLEVIRQLEPRVVHTSNPVYIALLRQRGVAALHLPLFGSIPILENVPPPPKTGGTLTFGLFGTLHPVWPPEPLFAHLRELGKKITIAHTGRLGSGEALWEKIAREYAGDFEFRKTGEQPPEKIAAFFAGLDFGIATTPWEIIGKSATVATLLEHGIPVIVNRDDVHFSGWSGEGYSTQLIKMDRDFPNKLASATRKPPHRLLPGIARQFLDALAGASHPPAIPSNSDR